MAFINNRINQSSEDDKFQKPTFYNRYLPFNETVRQCGLAWFEEIRENLSRSVQTGELQPGLVLWSNQLDEYLITYGFNFTKADHLKLIHFYLSILSIPDLSFFHAETCFLRLAYLLR